MVSHEVVMKTPASHLTAITVASQQEGSWFKPQQGLSAWSLDVLPFSLSDFLPWSKDLYVWLIGGSKLPVGVLVSVHGCCLQWTGVQVLSPKESWDRLQKIPVMDGWMDVINLYFLLFFFLYITNLLVKVN